MCKLFCCPQSAAEPSPIVHYSQPLRTNIELRTQTFPHVLREMHVPIADRYIARLSKLTATIRSLTQDTLCDGTAIRLRLDRSYRKNQQDATV